MAETLLIVEDEPLLRIALMRGLSALPIDVVGVESVAETRVALQRVRPSMLLTDYSLADGTGLDVVELLERHGHRVPTLVMTANPWQAGLAVRPHARVLEKPFSMSHLRALVARALLLNIELPPPSQSAAAED